MQRKGPKIKLLSETEKSLNNRYMRKLLVVAWNLAPKLKIEILILNGSKLWEVSSQVPTLSQVSLN